MHPIRPWTTCIRRGFPIGLVLLAGSLVNLPLGAQQSEPAPNDQQPPPARASRGVFDLPQLQAGYARLQRELQLRFQQGDYAKGEQLCRQLLRLAPRDSGAWYNLACAQARQDKVEESLASLTRAIENGFRDVELLNKDEDLASIRGREAFDALRQRAKENQDEKTETPQQPETQQRAGQPAGVEPASPQDGVVTVSEANTVWDPRRGVFLSFFRFGDAPDRESAPVKGLGETGELLRQWWAEGTAAGNHGDVYDNHDSDHSNMNYGAFPHLTRIEFDEAVRRRGLHHGLQNRFLYNAVTIGNSSTALVSGPFWRSQPRLALTDAGATLSLLLQYAHNHVYVYPEHRDHDPGHNGREGQGHGDVYPVNTPYLVISQGSSGSDRKFLTALAATLAALRPEVKQRLARQAAIAPTLQMILRRGYAPVASDADYLSGKAHPTVFDGEQLEMVRMVKLAQSIQPDLLPPLVQLRVVQESQPALGRDYFHERPVGNRLFDTPQAVARVVRSTNYWNELEVSAESSRDPQGKPLSYHWVVLRGDPDKIEITPTNEQRSVARIRVGYHTRQPVSEGSQLESNRVDIGVFVSNGTYYSAPAFVTFYFPDNEVRTYDDQQRIRVVDYADAEARKNYVDPLVSVRRDWRDEYHYDDQGRLTGWTRTRNGQSEAFTAEGRMVVPATADGAPEQLQTVRYQVRSQRNQPPRLEYEVMDEAGEAGTAGSGKATGDSSPNDSR